MQFAMTIVGAFVTIAILVIGARSTINYFARKEQARINEKELDTNERN